MTDPPVEQGLLPLRRPRSPARKNTPDGAADWRIVRYAEEPELADLNRHWRHPTAGNPARIRYAVELNGVRAVWGLRTRDAAVRWLARLTAPVQLPVPLDDQPDSASRVAA